WRRTTSASSTRCDGASWNSTTVHLYETKRGASTELVADVAGRSLMSRLSYFSRETLISLRRNLMMTVAGIITVAISLCLFGGILLVSTVVDHGTERWKH